MYSFDFQKRVRYGETDQMGYLYYGNYATYFEIGRVEMLRSLGFTYKALEEEHHVFMPVVSMQINYIRPAFYDELLTIRTTLKEMPGKYITFHMEIFKENGKICNVGRVRLCFVDKFTNKTIPTPEVMLKKLQPNFEEN
jgi:acyl-CoA thioester hydrolase